MVKYLDGCGAITGGHCTTCGFVFVPFQSLGCEKCGASGAALVETMLEARGTVFASAIVQHSPGPEYPVPFQIVSIRLDSGPIIRGMTVDLKPVLHGVGLIGTYGQNSKFADDVFWHPEAQMRSIEIGGLRQ